MRNFLNIYSSGFSLIELIFSILLIAIIASLAVPKIFLLQETNYIIELKSDLATIQNALKNYQNISCMKNKSNSLQALDKDDKNLFSNILNHPIISNDTYPFWSKQNNQTYFFNIDQTNKIKFIYNPATFTFLCNSQEELCQKVLR
jgi:prepilin-type N-terminal cleavage/methylation domain-containing protein